MTKKTILIAGGSGLVGKCLLRSLDSTKYHIHVLSRFSHENTADVSYYKWDIYNEKIEAQAVNADVIINLVGAGIADKRWTENRKRLLIESRVRSAELLLKTVMEQNLRPELYLSASAIGYYGSRGTEHLDEKGAPGSGFLSECCQLWEDAASMFEGIADRIVIARIGIVLTPKGGALPKMLMTKSLGLYSYFGDGKQIYSWIHIDDLVGSFLKIIADDSIKGIYNLVAPNPVSNYAFMHKCKEVFGGVLLLPVPAFVLKLIMGEMAHVVLDSAHVKSDKIKDAGYKFTFPSLSESLKDFIET